MSTDTLARPGTITSRTSTYECGPKSHRTTRTTTTTTFHLDPHCSHIVQSEIVGHGTAMDAEWDCDYCAPNRDHVFDAMIQERELAEDLAVAEYKYGNGPGPHRPQGVVVNPNGPTEKQVAFLTTLVGEKCDPAVVTDVAQFVADIAPTKAKASAAIDRFMAMPDFAPATSTTAPANVPAGVEIMDRANRYGGSCVLCGSWVEDEAGRLAKRGGKYVVAHRDGECVAATEQPVLADVPAGHYAIESTGDNDLAFYRVDRLDDGRVFVKMIVGGHPDQNVRRAAVAGILDRIFDAGPQAAAKRYADEIGRCARCNRHLTDDLSRERGLGPDCYGMMSW